MNYCNTAAKELLLIILFFTGLLNARAQQLKKAEYFYDTDPGFGKGTQLAMPAKKSIDSTLDFNVSSLSNGLHFLYVRAQDTSGKWGLCYYNSFIKTTGGAAASTPNYLPKVEYFFDKDPGLGKGTPLSISGNKTSIDSTFSFNVSALSNGLHMLYVRAQDEDENWSLGYNSSFIKQIGDDSLLTVNKVEYFLDVDPGFGKGTAIPVTEAANIDGTFNFKIPVNGDSSRTLYVRAQDSRGNWSLLYDTTLNPATLPLLITNFSGQYISGTNELTATFTNVVDVKTVELQKSADGFNFSFLGDMATGPNIGGTYNYDDKSPYTGKNYYRLRVIDNDGNTSFSNIVLLDNGSMLHVDVYPNPFHDNILVQFANAKAGNYTATIVDLAGRRLQMLPFALNQGNQAVTLQAGNYASGTYFVEIRDVSGNIILNKKIIKL